MIPSSDEKKFVELMSIIGNEKSLSEASENEILSVFDSRGEKAIKILKEKKLRKLILDENISIWEVKGKGNDYIIIEDNFCECTDFQFRVLRKGQKTLCYHLLAKMIGEKLELFESSTLSNNDYDEILEKRIKIK